MRSEGFYVTENPLTPAGIEPAVMGLDKGLMKGVRCRGTYQIEVIGFYRSKYSFYYPRLQRLIICTLYFMAHVRW